MNDNTPINYDIKFLRKHLPSMLEFAGEVETPDKTVKPVVVETPEQLEGAIGQQAETIIIEGGLATDVTRIKATGKLSWAVAIGTLCVNVLKVILEAKGGGQPSFTGSEKGKYAVQGADGNSIILKRI